MVRFLRIGLAIQLAAFSGAARAVSPDSGFGLGYFHPISQEISRPYGGGISVHAMGEIPASRFIRVGAEVGYRSSSASLPHPDFVDAARGTLRIFPIDLFARFAISRVPGVVAPWVGAGCELLWIKERFTYRMGTMESTRSPGARFGAGPLLAAGADRVKFPRVRLEVIASLVPIRRAITTGDASVITKGITSGSYGARILWRLP